MGYTVDKAKQLEEAQKLGRFGAVASLEAQGVTAPEPEVEEPAEEEPEEAKPVKKTAAKKTTKKTASKKS